MKSHRESVRSVHVEEKATARTLFPFGLQIEFLRYKRTHLNAAPFLRCMNSSGGNQRPYELT